VRLRVPDEGDTVFDDLVLGEVRSPNFSMDDLVIARADGTPLYNLAVAVDDLDARITDVVRGNDHLTNTAKQLLIIDALGAEPPRYGHLPLLHGPDGKKLSKRHGAASVQELRAAGYLPAAVRNYSRCSAGAPATTRRSSRREELVRASTSRACSATPRSSTSQAALAERPLHARAEPGAADGGA
jgi:glutamyl-tRNA synthetase